MKSLIDEKSLDRTVEEFKQHLCKNHKVPVKECIYTGCTFATANCLTFKVPYP